MGSNKIKLFLIICFASISITLALFKLYYKYEIYKIRTQPAQSSSSIPVDKSQPLEKSYNTWIQQEEKKIWQELKTQSKLSYDNCMHLKKKWYTDYQKGEKVLKKNDSTRQAVSLTTQNQIRLILKDFGITQNIEIISWKENSAAAATDTFLFINERVFSKLSPHEQKFIIGHEIQHYIHKDCSTNYTLNRYFMAHKRTLDKEHPINKFSRFQELRADIKSALHGLDYAKGYVAYMEGLSRKRDNNGISHPKNGLRLATGKELLTQFC